MRISPDYWGNFYFPHFVGELGLLCFIRISRSFRENVFSRFAKISVRNVTKKLKFSRKYSPFRNVFAKKLPEFDIYDFTTELGPIPT
jgi:hypothetical protein